MDYVTVSYLNNYIKGYLEQNSFLNKVYLKGELSNLKKQSNGHWYFSLKDETSRINAVMFAGASSKVNFEPKDGMNVQVEGRISAYPVSGSYQIYVNSMTLDGIGNLYIEFEKLKQKLYKEGLFNKECKKQIPKYPKKVGVITAQTGAAIRDIVSTINRRFPSTEVILFPSLVQGKDAASDIVRQIQKADTYNLDTLIVGRGGGSIEDLWSFNEEIVARAIFAAKTPIISAVGHEPDITISDYVADLRAPTPTGAAEMAVPTVLDTKNIIDQFKIRLNKNIKNTVNAKFVELRNFKQSYVLKNPSVMYEIKMQKLDNLLEGLTSKVENILTSKTNAYQNVKQSYILSAPEKLFDKQKNKLDIYLASLKNLNPDNVLEKGYAIIKVNDKAIKGINDIKVNDELNILIKGGSVVSQVKEKKNG